MGKILVIVESPGKIKKIEHILGKDYIVEASVGHILDLNPKTISVDIANKFTPNYEIMTGKEDVVKKLKSTAKKVSDILIATDEDREGEMIAWSIAYILDLKDPKRITFNSITEDELLNAVKNPRKIDNELVNAQKARRILDRIVGYEISPLLWKSIGASLSAGRVQSVVIKLIIERENEIKSFFQQDDNTFFKFTANFKYKTIPVKAILHDITKKKKNDNEQTIKGQQTKIIGSNKAKEFLKLCTKSTFTVKDVQERDSQRYPSPPFTTSTLQQEAGRKMGFSVKKTMTTAQILYESGYITYMRTDSVNLSDEAIKNIKKYIIDNHGDDYYKYTQYKSKAKNTQEAHEAIRPTDITNNQIKEGGKIGIDEIKLYSLIWKRAVASQMAPAKFNIISVIIDISQTKDYHFISTTEKLIFDGFLVVYNIKNLEEDEEEIIEFNGKIPKKGTELEVDKIAGVQDYQRPDSRYNEVSLVKKMEDLGIGRPSTYASIINKIQEDKHVYVKKEDIEGISKKSLTIIWNGEEINETENDIIIGKETNKLIPTTLGIMVVEFLDKYFPDIMNYEFTAKMEDQLDDIANNKLVWYNVLDTFYKKFHPIVDELKSTGEKINIQDQNAKILGIDPTTEQEIIATIGRYGPMIKTKDGTKFKYAPIKPPLTIDNITLQDALKLFEFPKILGKYLKKDIKLNRGKYGFYIVWGTDKFPVKSESVSLDDVIKLIEEHQNKILVEFKDAKYKYLVLDGEFGKYINKKPIKGKSKAINYKLPKDIDIKDLTLEKINEIISDCSKKKKKFRSFKKKETN